MTDDFESELRESLGEAVPAAPETQTWAAGARAYTHRVRRTRAALAVGAGAVVAAAAIVVPSVLASPDSQVAGTVNPTPSTKSPIPVPPLAHPFTCAMTGKIHNQSSISNGVVPSGAVLARLCPEGTRTWTAPSDPLVTDVNGLVATLNAQRLLPKGVAYYCPVQIGEESDYSLTFQYPDGHTASVTGGLSGCTFIKVGSAGRAGALTVLRDFLTRLHDQRDSDAPPPPQLRGPTCPVDPAGQQAVLVDGRSPGLTSAIACGYSLGARTPTSRGTLSDSEVAQLNADLTANATHQGAPVPCSQSFTLAIVGINAWGDQVNLVDRCSVFSILDREGSWYWTPSQQTSAMLESVQHETPADGRIAGRLTAVGGPPGIPPRPLSGNLTIQGDYDSLLVVVHEDGTFTGTLAPGRYRVVGHSPSYNDGKYECHTRRPFVTVRADQTTHVWVLCQER
jgi:hypothetical protein